MTAEIFRDDYCFPKKINTVYIFSSLYNTGEQIFSGTSMGKTTNEPVSRRHIEKPGTRTHVYHGNYVSKVHAAACGFELLSYHPARAVTVGVVFCVCREIW
ncbi:MAG: hypothetical protein JW881_07530 [Spirochaetales bacterium]|nr:hypothetical protein [Spirochaetales bacterium]